MAAAIRGLVETHKVKTKNVATSVSGHAVIIRKINLPLMTDEELETTLEWEAEQYIPFEVSDVNLDAQVLGPDAKDPAQMNVILVAAKKDVVDDYVALFRQGGLMPVIMDVNCFAVANVYEAEYGIAEQEVVALIDLGASSLNVNILKGGVPVFTRDIQIGGNLYKEELQKRFGLSSQDAETVKLGGAVEGVSTDEVTTVIDETTEAMTTDIQRSLDFFSASSSDDRPVKVFITGGLSKMAAIRTSLANRLGVAVQVIDPWRQVSFDRKAFSADELRDLGILLEC